MVCMVGSPVDWISKLLSIMNCECVVDGGEVRGELLLCRCVCGLLAVALVRE